MTQANCVQREKIKQKREQLKCARQEEEKNKIQKLGVKCKKQNKTNRVRRNTEMST